MQEPWGVVGDRSGRVEADTLRRLLQNTPTGRNLLVGGGLVAPIVTFDPNAAASDVTQIYPDGGLVTYIRAGVKELWQYDRANGWQQL